MEIQSNELWIWFWWISGQCLRCPTITNRARVLRPSQPREREHIVDLYPWNRKAKKETTRFLEKKKRHFNGRYNWLIYWAVSLKCFHLNFQSEQLIVWTRRGWLRIGLLRSQSGTWHQPRSVKKNPMIEIQSIQWNVAGYRRTRRGANRSRRRHPKPRRRKAW